MNTTTPATSGDTYTAVVNGGEPITVQGAKGMTVLCHQGAMQVDIIDADVREITCETTVAEAARLAADRGEWDAFRAVPIVEQCFRCVFANDIPFPVDLAKAPIDVRHIIGMISLLLFAIITNKRPFIRLPETYMHPANQLGLVDMLNTLMNIGKKSA
jgi:hypothetical protein